MLAGTETEVLELSALRQDELPRLLASVDGLDLSRFRYVSVHAPSRIQPGTEREIVGCLSKFAARGWPIVMHPDAIADWGLWADLGSQLCLENMDLRKPTGRTAPELTDAFRELPAATFCCDLGHARQVDPTMGEAMRMLRTFGDRLRQLHVSEVNSRGMHEPVSVACMNAFHKVHRLIPDHIPIVLESPVSAEAIAREIGYLRALLPPQLESPEAGIAGTAGRLAAPGFRWGLSLP
jgi:hypothetical protein